MTPTARREPIPALPHRLITMLPAEMMPPLLIREMTEKDWRHICNCADRRAEIYHADGDWKRADREHDARAIIGYL